MVDKVLFSHNSDDWSTPSDVLDGLRSEFGELFDPCPIGALYAWNPFVLPEERDGLIIDWRETNFVNPPYSKWQKWLEKGYEEFLKGNTSIFLVPARTDTRAFHKYVWDDSRDRPYPYVTLRFISGRLRFGGAKNGAPFPSMIIVFNPVKTTGNLECGD
jgi:site-specific DNA-methyltransferase (adenine-specific)